MITWKNDIPYKDGNRLGKRREKHLIRMRTFENLIDNNIFSLDVSSRQTGKTNMLHNLNRSLHGLPAITLGAIGCHKPSECGVIGFGSLELKEELRNIRDLSFEHISISRESEIEYVSECLIHLAKHNHTPFVISEIQRRNNEDNLLDMFRMTGPGSWPIRDINEPVKVEWIYPKALEQDEDGNYKVDLSRMIDIEDVKGGYKIKFNKREDDEVK